LDRISHSIAACHLRGNGVYHCHHSYHSSGILCYLTVASCRVLIESNENRQRLPPAPTRRKPYIDTSLPFLLLCSRRKPIYSQAVVATYVYIMTSGAPMQPRKRKTSLPARVFAPRAPNEANTGPDSLPHLGAHEPHAAPDNASRHMLRIGPAGWSYPDWDGFVYPSRRPRGFHEAAYLSEFFDTIEINTSFYQPLKLETAKQWVDLVSGNRSFVFTAKLWRRFTHDIAFTTSGSAEDERAVRAGFDVLCAAGKLGAVLLQFPFSFHRTKENMAYLSAVLLRFRDYPLVVEVRHDTWNAPETLALLHEHGAGICNIDQPIIGRSLAPSAQATSPVGYVRLHGRRYDTWFTDDENVPAHERYNYLYSPEELDPWIARVRKVSEHTQRSFVITNNHFQGKAVVNALELISILKNQKVKVPEPLRQHYPELNAIADQPPAEPLLFVLDRPRTP